MQLSTYFNGVWQDNNFESLRYSGYQLVDYVNSKNPSSVLDVGCGYNRFKGKIKNLIGIDPYNDAADIKTKIENFYPLTIHDNYDIVLCLGSINFGNEKTIDNQLSIINELFTKEAIFRVNPGIPHDWTDYGDIVWYKWTLDKIHHVAMKYNYDIKKLKCEYTAEGHRRLFFIFAK